MSIRWRDFFRVFCSVWVTLVCLVVSSEIALIGGSSPVSRSLSRAITHRFPPSFLAGLAFLFLFWLGSATDHSSHTPLLPFFSVLFPFMLSPCIHFFVYALLRVCSPRMDSPPYGVYSSSPAFILPYIYSSLCVLFSLPLVCTLLHVYTLPCVLVWPRSELIIRLEIAASRPPLLQKSV